MKHLYENYMNQPVEISVETMALCNATHVFVLRAVK